MGVPVVVPPPVLTKTYISPVESEVMNSLSFESSARPTGRKQSFGQLDRSMLVRMSTVEVVLSEFWIGEPEEKAIAESL